MFFFSSFFLHHHLKFSLFMSDDRQLRNCTFPWRLAIVTMVAGQYWRPLCHPCTPVTQRWRGHSGQTDTLHRGERECMDVLSVEGVHACILSGLSLHACVCLAGCVCVCARTHVCVCPHSVSQLSLQSVYVWLQGKSSSKKWILTRRAPHINSFSHIPTQKTTYLHCISPGTPFSFWWWFRDVEISPWTSEPSQGETVRQR